MNERVHIVLTGPPGSGKSVVGRLLADELGRDFVDMDDELSRRFGRTPDAVFASDGEEAFRKAEAELCKEVVAEGSMVIATGGGTLLDAANRETLESNGILVNLCASVETLAQRLDGDDVRPLLAGDMMPRLKELLAARRELYDSVTIKIDTEAKSPREVAEMIRTACEEQQVL